MRKVVALILIGLFLSSHLVPALAVSISNERDKLQLELEQLTKQIEATQAEIDGITNDLEWLTKQIIITYQKLEVAKQELKQQERGYNERLGEVYKNYYDFLVYFILDAPNFNSLWDRFSFLAKVNAADRQMLAERKRKLNEVKRLRKSLVEQKKQKLKLKKEKLLHLLALQKLKLQKQALLATLPMQPPVY